MQSGHRELGRLGAGGRRSCGIILRSIGGQLAGTVCANGLHAEVIVGVVAGIFPGTIGIEHQIPGSVVKGSL